jgi:hypothetical protein
MDFNVQPERGKSSREPRPRRHPIIMKANPQKTKPEEKTVYSSWLAVFPPLAVFFGRRSELVSREQRNVKRGDLTLVNVGQDTTLCDCDVSEKLVQFLIVADGELEMTRDNTGLLVIAGSVTSQLEDFGREVFENSCEVDGGT